MTFKSVKEPSREEWFNYIRPKFHDLPVDIIAYMSSIAAQPVKIPDEDENYFTTPRSCERYLESLAGRLYIKPNIDLRELSDFLAGCISEKDHYAFMGYYKERNTIIKYLQEGQEINDPAARWAASVYLGNLIKEHYDSCKEHANQRADVPFSVRHSIIDADAESIPGTIKKIASKQEEHLVSLVLGTQLFTTGQSPIESYKPAIFLIELANGKSIQESFEKSQKENDLTIKDWFENFNSVDKTFKNHAKTDAAKAVSKALLRAVSNQYNNVLKMC
jgi:hypothetical protein